MRPSRRDIHHVSGISISPTGYNEVAPYKHFYYLLSPHILSTGNNGLHILYFTHPCTTPTS